MSKEVLTNEEAYKKGDMFIVEITDTNCTVGLGEYCLNDVTYVTEKMLDEFTRAEKYNEAYKAGFAKAYESYKKILKTLQLMTVGDRKEVFGQNFAEDVIEKLDLHEIQEKLDLYEKAKAEEFKSSLCPRCIKECKIDVNRCEFGKFTNVVIKCPDFDDKDKIRVGDEVENDGETMIVTKITSKTTFCGDVTTLCGVEENGQIYDGDIMNWEKTGKHYPEIEKFIVGDED